ncbi:MAG: ribonuclease III [Bdellovibrionales bacterium]|nr:ribonuclease III [Bdellovibrionales bacterium]
MENFITHIESMIGEKLTHPEHIFIALTHRSFINESEEGVGTDNERLEFLGDSVLGLVVSSELMRRYPEEKEGVLSKYRSSLVNERVLGKVALSMDINQYLFLGKGEEKNAGRKKTSIMANAFEALIGAIYLSNGFACAQKFVLFNMESWIDQVQKYVDVLDYKSKLQEYTLKEFKCTPRYILVNQKGPDHFKLFETQVIIKDELMGKGQGRSKKDSEQSAAHQALLKIQERESV